MVTKDEQWLARGKGGWLEILEDCVNYHESRCKQYLDAADLQDRSDAWKNAWRSRQGAEKHKRYADACRSAILRVNENPGHVGD